MLKFIFNFSIGTILSLGAWAQGQYDLAENNPMILNGINFDCLNATGKRFTSKSGSILAKPFYAPYTTTTKGSDGKDINNTVNVQVEHAFRNGESLTSNFIVDRTPQF